MRARVLLAVLALGLAGCLATRENPVAEDKIPFRVGRTTYREVVESWGNPSKISGDTREWTVRETLGGQVKVSYHFIGFTVRNESSATRTHRLAFDSSGTLTNLTTVVSGTPTYSLNPW